MNLNGDVVGINAAIATADSGGVQVPGQQTQQSGSIGIGFAIPSDEASRIAGELIATGKATHAVIGVSVADSTAPEDQHPDDRRRHDQRGHRGRAGGEGRTAGRRRGDQGAEPADHHRHRPGRRDPLVRTRPDHQPDLHAGGQSHTVKVTLGTANS